MIPVAATVRTAVHTRQRALPINAPRARNSLLREPVPAQRPSYASSRRLQGPKQSLPRCIALQATPMSALVSQSHDTLSALASVPALWPVLGAVGCCVLGVIYAFWDALRRATPPELTYQSTQFNDAVLSRMPALRRPLKPLPFLTIGSGHIETIWAAKTRTKIDVTYRREVLQMPDGGIVSIDWRKPREGEQPLPDDAPVLILLPGLTGGGDDSYVRYAAHYAETHGTRIVVFNSRGCGDTFVTTPRYYSGLYIGDMQRVVQAVRVRHPKSHMFAAGWSLGANILTNYLGLVGEDTPLDAAAVMCNPFDLVLGSHNLKKGFNQIYSKNLGSGMSKLMRRNRKVWNGAGAEFDIETACNAPSVRAWDHAITRVSFGFKTVDDYYKAASSAQRASGVAVPLLVIQAADDPIAPIAGTPAEALYDNPNCILAVTKTGGHLGWMTDVGGYFGEPWTDKIIIEWLLSVQVQIARDAAVALEGRNGSRLPPPATPPGTVKPLPATLQPSVHNSELSLQRTPPLTVTSSSDGASDGFVATRANSRGSPPTHGVMYDAISGLPTQKHDGVTLSPSQTGYFGPGEQPTSQSSTAANVRAQNPTQNHAEGVYKGATPAHSSIAAACNSAATNASSESGGGGGSGAVLPVSSEQDVDLTPRGRSGCRDTSAAPARLVAHVTDEANRNGSSRNVAAKSNSSRVEVNHDLGCDMAMPAETTRTRTGTPDGQDNLSSSSSSSSRNLGVGAGAVSMDSKGTEVSTAVKHPVLASRSGRGKALHVSRRPSGALRGEAGGVGEAGEVGVAGGVGGGGATAAFPPIACEAQEQLLQDQDRAAAGIHATVEFHMTQDGLVRVPGRGGVASSSSTDTGTVTAPRLQRVPSQHAAQHAADRSAETVLAVQAGEGAADGAQSARTVLDWANATPQRVAGAAATITMMLDAVSGRRTSARSSSQSGQGADVLGWRAGDALRSDPELLAALGESVARALKGAAKGGSLDGGAVTDAGTAQANGPSAAAAADSDAGAVYDSDLQKQLNVLSGSRVSSGGHMDGLSDGLARASFAAAAAPGVVQRARSAESCGRAQNGRVSGSGCRWVGPGKSLWWDR